MPLAKGRSLFIEIGIAIVDRTHRQIFMVADTTPYILAQPLPGHVRGRTMAQVEHSQARVVVRDPQQTLFFNAAFVFHIMVVEAPHRMALMRMTSP